MIKTDTTNFGFEILATYLLPGIAALLAVLVAHGIDAPKAKVLLNWGADAQFLTTFLLLSGVTLMGAIVATSQAIIETFILDRVTAKRIGITEEKFNDEWIAYVKDLPRSKNSYISRVVLFFQFETRMGFAFIVLGGFLFKLSCTHAIAAIVIGAILYAVGMMHHKELGEYRHRCYLSEGEKPHQTQVVPGNN